MKHLFRFQFTPNLILLLGEQLIHDKKIALSELVKNSYDADASEVEVIIEEDKIVIQDNGCGMNIDTIKNIWLRPGISNKKSDVEKSKVTPKFKRLPIGEKGVGRLGSHKLGHTIELYTKQIKDKEIYLKLHWKILESHNDISEIPDIEVIENSPPKVFKDLHTGTKIIISELKESWDSKDIKTISDNLFGLVSPFSSIENFNIKLKFENKIVSNDFIEKIERIKKNALFYFKATCRDGKITDFQYRFSPWKGFEKVKKRSVSLSQNQNLLQKLINDDKYQISLSQFTETKYRIGEITFQGFLYDFDNILWGKQRTFSKEEKTEIKNYLKQNGGIRVYRDTFRVFNYGEAGNDILNLDLERVNRPAGKISSNQILAAVNLSRSESADLIEKTNREGFIHNAAFGYLQKWLSGILDIVSDLRMDDKDALRRVYVQKEKELDSINHKIESIKSIIDKTEIDDTSKKKIFTELDNFEKEFTFAKDMLINASQTGISLSFIIHEIEKILFNLEKEIKLKNWDRIKEIFKYLNETVSAYKNTIKLDRDQSLVSVNDTVQKAIFNCKARFDFHNISVETDISKECNILAKQNLIIGILNNLFDNSIYWLNFQKIEHKKIYIKCYLIEREIHLLVADNGKGFTISFDSALSAFVSGRKDESSMGLGLHLSYQVMEAHKGHIVEGVFKDEKLPVEFHDGAIIKLIFPKEV